MELIYWTIIIGFFGSFLGTLGLSATEISEFLHMQIGGYLIGLTLGALFLFFRKRRERQKGTINRCNELSNLYITLGLVAFGIIATVLCMKLYYTWFLVLIIQLLANFLGLFIFKRIFQKQA